MTRAAFAVLILAATAAADKQALLDAIRGGDAARLGQALEAAGDLARNGRDARDICLAVADLALRIDPGAKELAEWQAVADKLDAFAQQALAAGRRNLYAKWAVEEAKIFRWRLKQKHDPDDGMEFLGSVRDLAKSLDRTTIALDGYLRAAQVCAETSSYPEANVFSAVGALVYLHRKMELLELEPAGIDGVKAAFLLQDAALSLGADKGDEAPAKIEAGLERLRPHLKREATPFLVARHNDLVNFARQRLDRKPDYHAVWITKPKGVRYGVPVSMTWRIVGDTVWQIAPEGKPLRAIRVARHDGKADLKKLARQALAEDRKVLKHRRKQKSGKAAWNEKIRDAWSAEAWGLDAARRYRKRRHFFLRGQDAVFVVFIEEYREKLDDSDPGFRLFRDYFKLD